MITKDKIEKLETRPPVVVILGHVDHGKTTLLTAIKDFGVLEKESGGITQHVGAYQVERNGKKITFIDTPGHEAFSQMRSRGARVADIAVLVIAAEEGIKPQTKEVISHIKKYKIPVVVALNKIDKPEANAAKVIGELVKEDIVVESQGGDVPSVNISAKNGQGVDELLEILLLVAEMEELGADPKKSAEGVVIESYLDSQRGPTATLLIREGTLKKSDIVVCGDSWGKLRILEDFQGNLIQEAPPSTPAVVIGLNEAPTVGERFRVVDSEGEAKSKLVVKEEKAIEIKEGEKILNLILKADVEGSLEAIEGTLKNAEQEDVSINVLKGGVGDISESDIKLAYSTGATIVGFRVKSPTFIFNLAKRQGVRIKTFEVIYELVEEVKKGLAKLLEPEIVREDLGKLRVIAIFRKEKSRMIVGGKVTSGKVENKAQIDVIRDKKKIASGRVAQLQHNKKDVSEVEKGKEAGILFEGNPIIEERDILEAYKEEKRAREL